MRAVLLLLIIAGFSWVSLLRRKDRVERRGRTLLTEREAGRREARSGRSHQGGNITWGGVRLPREAETSHFLAVGTTGSGKSLTLGKLMEQALSGARPGSGTRALVYDPKQDVLSFLAALELEVPVMTMNPFDKRCVAWDMGADVTSPATALQVATAFIPKEEGGSSTPYFTNVARDLFAGVELSFIASGNPWGLSDVLIAMRSRERLDAVLNRTDIGQELLRIHANSERTFSDVLSTARSLLAPLTRWQLAGGVLRRL